MGGGGVPEGEIAEGFIEVLEIDGESAAPGSEAVARGVVGLESAGVESGGHDDDFEIWAEGFLEGDGASEGDIAVEMAFVELVEDDDIDAPELGIGEHLAEENAFGDEADAGFF